MSDGLFTPDKETFERLAKEWIERTKKAMIYGTSHPEIYKTAQEEEIERLRAENETLRRDVKTAVMGDSAELQDVKRENEKLRAALKPFGEALKDNYCHQVDGLPIIAGSNQMDIRFNWTLGDLRAAAAAIRESENEA